MAHESKVGYTSLSKRMKTQILKDAKLVSRGKVGDAVWHFYRSNATGKIGPSEPLKKFLCKNCIDYVVHEGVIL